MVAHSILVAHSPHNQTIEPCCKQADDDRLQTGDGDPLQTGDGDPLQGRRHVFTNGGHVAYARCRRQCIEVRSGDQFARSAEIFFRLHFSVIRMGSRGTFVLCIARSRCMRSQISNSIRVHHKVSRVSLVLSIVQQLAV